MRAPGTHELIAGTLGLALLALAGNVLSVPLLFGVHLIFGSIAVMLAVALLGTFPALLVAIAGGLYTLELWGHPYALVVFSLEALTVGRLHRRGLANLVLADLLYWLLLGTPLVLLSYRGLMGQGWEPTVLIALKQSLNGVFNALLASLLLLGLRLSRRTARCLGLTPPSLADLLFHVLLTAILLTGLVPLIQQGYSQRATHETFMEQRLTELGRHLAGHLEAESDAGPRQWSAQFAGLHANPGTWLALVSHDGRVLARRGEGHGAGDPAGELRTLREGLSIWLPAGEMPVMQRWKEGRYRVSVPVSGVAGVSHVIVEQAAAPLVRLLERGRLTLFVFLAGLLLVGILVSRALSRWLTRPLSALEAASRNLATQIAEEKVQPLLPDNPVREYGSLGATLRDMADSLATSFHDLRDVQAGLEDQIQTRTVELARLSEVARQTTNGVVITDTQGRVEWINEGFSRMTGYDLEALRGRTPGEVLQGEATDPGTVQRMHDALAHGASFDVNVLNYHRSGEPYWVHISCNPLRDGEGRLQGFMAIESDITRQKHAAERIRASERRLAAVIEGTHIGTWEWNVQTGETTFNERWAEIVGHSLEALAPVSIQTWMDLAHPDDLALSGAMLERHFAGEVDYYDVQCRMRHKDGHWVWVHDRGRVVTWTADGRPLLMSGTHADITEQKHAESELNQFKSTLDRTLDCVFMFEAESLRFFYVNEGAVRQVGHTREELLSLHPYDLTPEISEREFHALITPLRSGEQTSRTIETLHRRRTGRCIPVEIFLQYMAPVGEAARFVAIVRDISERKQAELARQEQAQRTQAIIDNMVDGLITIDESGRIESFNPAAERIFGYAAQAVVGRNVKVLMPGPHRGAHDDYVRAHQVTGLARILGAEREVEGRRRDGNRFPMGLSVSKISRQGKPLYVGMVRDITERKRVERMKTEFVSTVSHELRTPLTAISGSLALVAGGALGEVPGKARQMIGIACKNSQRLTYLINDLLDMEKLVAGKMHLDMQPQALMPLVEQAVETNQTFGSERRVIVTLTARAPDARVRVDSQRVLQILANLLSNAIKFSPEGGEVEIAVEIAVEHGGDCVRVWVKDHGPGIPEGFRTRIFDKFAQADASDSRQKSGTGLGLAISQELVTRMGGRIGFESVEGQGAAFFFELPLHDAGAPGIPQAAGGRVPGLH